MFYRLKSSLNPNVLTLIFDDICYWRTFQKLNFNGSLDLCHNYGMDLLTNQYPGYTKIVELENVDGKIGRKVLWIGAQMRLRNQWFWVQNRTLEWPWNGVEVESQPWGLQEPSGDDCVVADSALQWQWNSTKPPSRSQIPMLLTVQHHKKHHQ